MDYIEPALPDCTHSSLSLEEREGKERKRKKRKKRKGVVAGPIIITLVLYILKT